MSPVHLVTYLAPSLPETLFAAVADALARALAVRVTLRCETLHSGPTPGEVDPFSTGEADLAFLCAPTYLWLRDRSAPVALVGAPVFDDPRAAGRPVYFADVVVAAVGAARRFDDLAGARFCYNDDCSLSGYLCLLDRLAKTGRDLGFLDALEHSGSHLASLARVADGRSDAAAIDSNVLALARRRDPSLDEKLRVIESWGPYPVQPAVVRTTLDADLRARLATALLALDGRALGPFGVRGFVPVSDGDYECERRALAAGRALVKAA